jgi:hypothetical protein
MTVRMSMPEEKWDSGFRGIFIQDFDQFRVIAKSWLRLLDFGHISGSKLTPTATK